MGAAPSSLECCVRRDDGGGTGCDVDTSLFGEDAYYRDAFYDCDEGNRSHDRAFSLAREQARLKMRKGRVLAKYASFAVKQQASNASKELKVCIATHVKGASVADLERRVRAASCGRLQDAPRGGSAWLGKTVREWTGKELPETGTGPFWSKGFLGQGLKVRCGPNYKKTGTKVECSDSMYEALSCDAIKSTVKIENVIGGYVRELPPPPEKHGESDRGGGSALQWTPDCPLPRIICINMMLPYETGLNPFKKDPGCSVVGMFHIKPETIHSLRTPTPPPCIKLLKDFCAGPAGRPDGPAGDPERSLFSRVQKRKKKDQQAGLFKAIAHCVNPQDVHVPDLFHTYNGKPVLIAKCGYIVKDPAGEWIEIGVDVRGFNVLARKMLCSFRGLLPRTKIHYGFTVQGVEDDELPEGLLCDMYVHGINMVDDPIKVEAASEAPCCSPRASEDGMADVSPRQRAGPARTGMDLQAQDGAGLSASESEPLKR